VERECGEAEGPKRKNIAMTLALILEQTYAIEYAMGPFYRKIPSASSRATSDDF
jgi:hypothetical protein